MPPFWRRGAVSGTAAAGDWGNVGMAHSVGLPYYDSPTGAQITGNVGLPHCDGPTNDGPTKNRR